MTGSIRRLAVASFAVLVTGAPAAAQSAPAPAGPTIETASAALRAQTAGPFEGNRRDASIAIAQQNRPGLGRSEALMIVGGAMFLAGAIIGDDAGTIIMVGGAAIGLYGLFLYLQ